MNILHGIGDPKKLKTRTIERAQTGSAAVDERLVDIEKEQLHSLTTHQFFLGFKDFMSFDRIYLQFEPARGVETSQAVGKDRVCHFVFASASGTDHRFYLLENC